MPLMSGRKPDPKKFSLVMSKISALILPPPKPLRSSWSASSTTINNRENAFSPLASPSSNYCPSLPPACRLLCFPNAPSTSQPPSSPPLDTRAPNYDWHHGKRSYNAQQHICFPKPYNCRGVCAWHRMSRLGFCSHGGRGEAGKERCRSGNRSQAKGRRGAKDAGGGRMGGEGHTGEGLLGG